MGNTLYATRQLQFAVAEGAYTSGNTLDGLKTMNIGLCTKAKIVSCSVLDYQDLAANGATVDLHFFRGTPTGTITDNVLVALTDVSTYLGTFVTGTAAYLDVGGYKVWTTLKTAIGMDLVLEPDTSGNVYVVAVIKAASDFAAASAGAGLDIILGLELTN